ncbi:RHS repeat-associated core domain-containing protein [Lysobacter firmicutimachus]|uniref:RHS repeat-associated core domain-containing protein n=1 Tax=Lysobacter firmicutimachus TaxID=1792846 RepID=A0AAU8MTR8_9GAMM
MVRDYDAVGNTTRIGGAAKEFIYNANDRMSQVKSGGVVNRSYRYNARGERVAATNGASGPVAIYTLYDEAGHWIGDYDANGAAQQQAVWLGDAPVGLLAGAGAAQKLHYVQPDHLGTPRAVIDADRNVAIWSWNAKGEAFGNDAPNQDPDQDGTAFVFDLRFPGQRFDAATGLNYNYFRDYEPGLGRYVQSDPIGLKGGHGTYTYSASSPLRFVDPTGETPVAAAGCFIPGVGWGACAAIGAGAAVVGACYLTGACQAMGEAADKWLDGQRSDGAASSSSDGGLATGPAPYSHADENEALYFVPDPFGGGDACNRLAHAIRVLRAQNAWRKTDLNPRSATYPGHKKRIDRIAITLISLEASYTTICGGRCPD